MKLGLISDIHEDVSALTSALKTFRREAVDQVVVLGDIYRDGSRVDEACQLLHLAGACGVWGNHDFGIADDPEPMLQELFPESTLTFMSCLRPHLEIEGCYFSHNEPWLNPNDVGDLWYADGPPDTADRIERIFASVPHHSIFAGHMHRWLLATPQGVQLWAGRDPIDLNRERSYVVLGAACNGSFAVFDTTTSVLTPFNLL